MLAVFRFFDVWFLGSVDVLPSWSRPRDSSSTWRPWRWRPRTHIRMLLAGKIGSSFLCSQVCEKAHISLLAVFRDVAQLVSLFFLFKFDFASLRRMEFCTFPAQRSKKQKDLVPDSCYRRLKGILFFNRHTPISNNKLKILLDERKDLSSALEDASTERRLPQEFRTWLEKCHRELDKEV